MASQTVFLTIDPVAYALIVVAGMVAIGLALGAILDEAMGWFGLGIAHKGGN